MPILVVAYQVNSAGVDQTTLVSPSFAPASGEVIVVKAGSSHGDGGAFPTPTGGGLTYTLRQHDESASRDRVALWTAVVGTAPGSMSVSLGSPGAVNNRHCMVVERWVSAKLAPAPGSVIAFYGTPGTPSTSITTQASGSVVSWLNSDFNAVNGSSRTYITSSGTPVETGFLNDTSNGVHYFAYQPAVVAGAQTFGLTAPGGQAWTLIGLEILDAPVSGFGTVIVNVTGGTANAQDTGGRVTVG